MSARPQGPDRRQRPTPLLNRYFLRGRRRGPRRADELRPCYVDRPGRWWVLQIAWLVLVGLFDLLATHYELTHQLAVEANPIMRMLLEQTNVWVAWGSKLVVTVAGAWLLLAHVRWRYARVGIWVLNLNYGYIVWLHVTHLLG